MVELSPFQHLNSKMTALVTDLKNNLNIKLIIFFNVLFLIMKKNINKTGFNIKILSSNFKFQNTMMIKNIPK